MPQALPLIAIAFHTASVLVPGTGWLVSVAQLATVASVSQGVSAIVANNSKPAERGGSINMQVDPSAPRRLQIGKTNNPGQLTDWFLSGKKNSHLHMVVYLSEGPCGRVTRIFAGGRLVHDTPLTHGVKTEITAYRSGQDGDPGPRLWVTYYDGRPGQEAAPDLVALDQGWTTNNKMTGMAYVVVEAWWDSDNQRAPPKLVFENEGAKLYDRRKDSTAGGSGSHRADDPSTWEITDGNDTEGANPMVAIDHITLGRYLNGRRVFGIGQPPSDVPYNLMAHHANISDEDVAKKAGGTQKRYRASGIVYASEDHDTVIRKLAQQMGCTAADFGGRFGLVGMEARTPVLEIDDGDLIAGMGDFYSPKRPWSDLFSGVEGKFQDPSIQYQMNDYPPLTVPAWEEEDGGEARMAEFTLEFETDVERAQRLALMRGNFLRRQATLRGVYPTWVGELERGDWFVRTGPRWGEDGKIFEVLDRSIDTKTGAVTIVANEVDPDDSAWDEELAKDPLPGPTAADGFIPRIEKPVIAATAISLVGTSFSKPAIRVEWEPTDDPRVKWIVIEGWPTASANQKFTASVALPSDINFAVFDQGIVDGPSYTIRARFVGDRLQSLWSTTTTATPISPFEIGGFSASEIMDDLAANSENLIQQMLTQSAWRAAMDPLMWVGGETAGTVAMSAREIGEDNALSFDLLGTRTEDDEAFVFNAETVLIPAGTGGGSAKSLQVVRTEHDEFFAAINFLLESIGGKYAGVTLTTNVNGHINGLKFWNDGTPEGSGFVILAHEFAIVDPGNGLTDPFFAFSVVGGTVYMDDVAVSKLKADTIETEHLKVNSIAEIMIAEDGSNQTIPSDQSYISAISANYTSISGFVRIDALTQIYRSSADGSRGNVTVQLKLNGTVVETRTDSNLFANSGSVNVDREWTFIIDDVPAATNTWSLHVSVGNGGSGWGSWTKDNARLIFTELKRVE